ncbi:hypothetical protein ACQV5M_20710, partial [Leptospira sp. SA-E8]|uniref:hypothetical protein n=1 Tax=Leptospira sp. SA-E8 TaxID=3422259 RepID=UPI003EC0C224
MGIVSISNSGTAWLRDMAAQGKSPAGGWANSPNAAYYASLDSDNAPASAPSTSAKALPSSLEELIKMQQEAAKKDDEDELAEEMRKQIDKVASDGVPMTGNLV